jgi:hypothetical protein
MSVFVFGKATFVLRVLWVPLLVLFTDIRPSGAFQNLRLATAGRTTTTIPAVDLVSYLFNPNGNTYGNNDIKTVLRSFSLAQAPTVKQPLVNGSLARPLFGIRSIQFTQHRASLLRMQMAKEDLDEDNDSISTNEDSLRSKMKRLVTYPFRKVKTLFRRGVGEKLDMIDMNMKINGEESDYSTTTTIESSSTTSNDDVDAVKDAPLSPSPPPTPTLEPGPGPGPEPASMSKSPSDDIIGDRWAVAAPTVDLSGHWDIKPFVTENFKRQYDNYLRLLGQPGIVRSVAVSIVGLTTEETAQSDQGRELLIRGRNVRGIWERTLTASGADRASVNGEYTPVQTVIITADAEAVQSEAWWEQEGTVHRSWLRGVTKYGGGEFESKRYLEDGGNVLVCESTFHPADPSREKAHVTWRFQRQGAVSK